MWGQTRHRGQAVTQQMAQQWISSSPKIPTHARLIKQRQPLSASWQLWRHDVPPSWPSQAWQGAFRVYEIQCTPAVILLTRFIWLINVQSSRICEGLCVPWEVNDDCGAYKHPTGVLKQHYNGTWTTDCLCGLSQSKYRYVSQTLMS